MCKKEYFEILFIVCVIICSLIMICYGSLNVNYYNCAEGSLITYDRCILSNNTITNAIYIRNDQTAIILVSLGSVLFFIFFVLFGFLCIVSHLLVD
jgi:uncharacterized membrane protein YccF (DUF307 family)